MGQSEIAACKGLISPFFYFKGGCGLFEQVFRGFPQTCAKFEIPL